MLFPLQIESVCVGGELELKVSKLVIYVYKFNDVASPHKVYS